MTTEPKLDYGGGAPEDGGDAIMMRRQVAERLLEAGKDLYELIIGSRLSREEGHALLQHAALGEKYGSEEIVEAVTREFALSIGQDGMARSEVVQVAVGAAAVSANGKRPGVLQRVLRKTVKEDGQDAAEIAA